ncbi:uncharacterized protein L203_102326 [Cryptococcus depauperatus CBS 7841]|uniref:Uncharacterized protein n=1 Tax=Cryptococcus depauperatus CBS 7841 TaxID=1295531 RepID=A0A1E3IA44_9TREE|nr:B2-aldehyde-forming enzyme [Cryptococcus depauperatus CBS 7841]
MIALFALFHLLPLLALAAHSPPHHRRSHERVRKNYGHNHERDSDAPAIIERENHFDNRTIVEREHYDNRTLVPRGQTFNGVGTFYYTGLGACGQHSNDGDFMVALNSAQYGGGYPGPQCFKYITIQMGSKQIGGVQIMDECPTCDYGSLDLSPGLFTQFAGQDAGTIHITWWFNDDPAGPTTTDTPTSTYVPPTSTYVPPTTTSSPAVPPSSSSTSWVQPSSQTTSSPTQQTSQTSSPTNSITSPTAASVSGTSNTTNPFAVVSNATTGAKGASISVGADVSAAVGANGASVGVNVQGNLEAFNALAAQYGQLVVKAALKA